MDYRGDGIIYVIESMGFHKIGITTNLKRRLESYKSCNPQFRLIFSHPVKDRVNMEQFLHKYILGLTKKRYEKEWVIFKEDTLANIIKWCKNEDAFYQSVFYSKVNFYYDYTHSKPLPFLTYKRKYDIRNYKQSHLKSLSTFG